MTAALPDRALESAVSEIDTHAHAAGWDRPPMLFALVSAERVAAGDPEVARRLGLDQQPVGALAALEQKELPDQPLDELLAGISWPENVDGCAVTQEIVVLPPSAEAGLTEEQLAARAIDHPERREARLVVGVSREGASMALLRLRGRDGAPDEVVTAPDLAPNLVTALLETLG